MGRDRKNHARIIAFLHERNYLGRRKRYSSGFPLLLTDLSPLDVVIAKHEVESAANNNCYDDLSLQNAEALGFAQCSQTRMFYGLPSITLFCPTHPAGRYSKSAGNGRHAGGEGEGLAM